MLNKFLFKQIDNTSLVVFRVFFGLLICLEGFGAILTGWVKRTFIDPENLKPKTITINQTKNRSKPNRGTYGR